MTRRLRAALAAVLLVALLAPAAVVAGGPPRPSMALGVSRLAQATPEDDLAELDLYTEQAGRKPAMWMIWSDWGGPNKLFPTGALVDALKARGIAMMVTWQPVKTSDQNSPTFTYRRINDGVHDPYIRAWAQAAAAYEGRVLLRFAHEMDAFWFPWGMTRFTNTPKNFKIAWKRIHGIFQEEGATNVKFVWSPNQPCQRCVAYSKLYPGNAYVDYVGFSAFNWGPPKATRSMVKAFDASMKGMAQVAPKKKVIVTETGSYPAVKAEWLEVGLPAVYQKWQKLKGIVYFDINAQFLDHRDWRLTQPEGAMTVWAEMLTQGRFRGVIP